MDIISLYTFSDFLVKKLKQKSLGLLLLSEDYFETFVQIYDDQFSWQYGFWRHYVEQEIYRYLDCGDFLAWFCGSMGGFWAGSGDTILNY